MQDPNTSENAPDEMITPKGRVRKHPPKKKVERKHGRPAVDPEVKLSNRRLKDEKRKAYIKELLAEGKITHPEARDMARKAKVSLDDPVIDTNIDSGTYDDIPSPKAYDKYMEKLSLQKASGGRGLTLLEMNEKNQFIAYLEAGMGRYQACRQLKCSYSRFYNSFLHDPVFKEEVKTVEKSLIGMCEAQIYNAALNGDISSAERFIRIKHQGAQTAFGNRIAISEHKLKKKAVEAQIGAMAQNNRPSFACLTDAELDDYNNITERVQSGQPVSSDDQARLGTYAAKLIRANSPNLKPPTDFVSETANTDIPMPSIETTFEEVNDNE